MYGLETLTCSPSAPKGLPFLMSLKLGYFPLDKLTPVSEHTYPGTGQDELVNCSHSY